MRSLRTPHASRRYGAGLRYPDPASAGSNERDDYLACLRVAAKPTIAKSAASMPIAHSESVGMAVPLPTNGAQLGTVIVAAAVVTVPPNAKALPVKFALSPIVIPAASRIFPTNALVAPSVVAPTGAQYTSDSQAPPVKIKLEFAPVVTAPPVDLKM